MNQKTKFVVNASIISIYNIALAIFFYLETRGDFITIYFILPTVLFVVLYIITIARETDFSKRSYNISHLFNYLAILATIIITIGIYTNESTSPGGGSILFLFGALWVIPMIIAIVTYLLGFFAKSGGVNDQVGLSKTRGLFFAINIIISAFYLIALILIIREYVVYDNKNGLDFTLYIPLLIGLIASFVTRKKSSAVYWTIQILTLILTIYLALSAFGFSLSKMQDTPRYPMPILSSPTNDR